MKPAKLEPNIIDHYYSILKKLSNNDKLDLITRLSESMKTHQQQEKDKSWQSLFGALELDESADEFVERLENDRSFSRASFEL